jgi:hypothetical protein
VLQNSPLGPEDIERLVMAYEQTLRGLGLKDRSDPITQLIAKNFCWRPLNNHRWPDGSVRSTRSDRPAGFLLSDNCAIRRVSAGSDVLDPDRDDITATQLALDRQVEHGEVASAASDLKFRPDRPDVFGAQRGLCSAHLALIPGHSLMGAGIAFT